MRQKIIAIVGPTASGKTEYGLQLAKARGGEIISVDSRQVYQYLAVGTAKPTGYWTTYPSPPPSPKGRGSNGEGVHAFLVQGIPYHLVDIWDPAHPFTAADFIRLASEKIAEIRSRGKEPILVGGTGMYFKALIEGLAPLPPANLMVRAELRTIADQKGRAFLHTELARVDPEAARKIPANNIQRVVRALEVFRLTGKPISVWHREHQAAVAKNKTAPFQMVGFDLPLAELHRRIAERCEWMFRHGLIEETQNLLKKGYAPDCPAFTGLGYPRVLSYLKGTISKDELLALLTRDTRQYAKRQRTWFKHQMKVLWKKS